jgi:hypothetical protein
VHLIVSLVVQLGLLVAGWKLWRWARRREKAAKVRWRRRFAAAFFVSPMIFAFLLWLLPENPLIVALATLNRWLDQGVESVIGTAQESLRQSGAVGVLAVKPVIRSLVYAALGAAVGWPLDRFGAGSKGAEGTEGGGSAGSEAEASAP